MCEQTQSQTRAKHIYKQRLGSSGYALWLGVRAPHQKYNRQRYKFSYGHTKSYQICNRCGSNNLKCLT